MDYRKLTKCLIAQIRELQGQMSDLQDELDEAYDSMETVGSYHEAQNRRLHAELSQAECETLRERNRNSSRQFERDHVLRDLETARRRGDEWGHRRAMNRLRDL